MTTTTSIEARDQHEASGTAASNRETVLSLVRNWPNMTAVELYYIEKNHGNSGIDRHEVSRRLPELRKRDLVHNGKERLCTMSKPQTRQQTWLPGPAPTTQKELFQ